MYFFGNILFLVFINRNRDVLRRQMLKVVNDLSNKSKQRLKKWSIIFAFFGFANLTRACIGFIFIEIHWHDNVSKIVIFTMLDLLSVLGSFTTSALVYLIIVKVIYFGEIEYFDRLVQKVKSREYLKDVQTFVIKINKQRRDINEIKNKLIDCLSCLPVLWFFNLFLYISGIVVFAQRNTKKQILLDSLTNGLDVVYELGLVITVIVSVDEVNYFVEKKSREVCDFLLEDSCYFEVEPGLRDFKERCVFHFSVSGLFTLNKRLFLGFLSSLLSFTTLFIQIASSIYTVIPSEKAKLVTNSSH